MSSDLSILSFVLGYLFMVLGDGCLLVAATVAASSGGKAYKWGLAFGIAHGTFTLIGLLIASTIAESSEILGHLVVLFALVYLLRHFLHHRSHKGRCGCLDHEEAPNSFIWGVSFAFSIHALASGAILQQVFQGASTQGLLGVAACSAAISGCLVMLVVKFSEEYRSFLLRFFDAAPSVTVGLLSAAILFVVIDLISESLGSHEDHSHLLPWIIALCGGIGVGMWSRTRFRREAIATIAVPSELVSIRRSH